jgi:hypothetical protein
MWIAKNSDSLYDQGLTRSHATCYLTESLSHLMKWLPIPFEEETETEGEATLWADLPNLCHTRWSFLSYSPLFPAFPFSNTKIMQWDS